MSDSKIALALFLAVVGTGGFAACSGETPDNKLLDDEPVTKDAGGDRAAPEEPEPDPPQPDPQPTGACDKAKPFGAPVPVSVNSAVYETGPRLSADELTLYFARSEAKRQMFSSTRATKDAAFGESALVPGLGDEDNGYLTTTTDEMRAFFASKRTGSKLLDVYTATRAAATGTWENVARVESLAVIAAANPPAAGVDDDNPWVLGAGNALYYDSKRASGFDDFDIFRAGIEAGVVSNPVGIGTVINTAEDEENPVVSADELTLFFARRTTANKQEVFVSTRAAATDAWGTPVEVPELNSPENDRPGWISADGCRIYISSQRANGAGLGDLYSAVRPQ
jgi:hypothetical protein